MISGLTVREEAVLEDEMVWDGVAQVAASISRMANDTSAKIGITFNRIGDVIRIGPRGAAAIPVEFGSVNSPAKRYVKRALDAHRVD